MCVSIIIPIPGWLKIALSQLDIQMHFTIKFENILTNSRPSNDNDDPLYNLRDWIIHASESRFTKICTLFPSIEIDICWIVSFPVSDRGIYDCILTNFLL